MHLTSVIPQIKPPCLRCPYRLGLVHTVVIPCPQCRSNGYRMFAQLQKSRQGQEEKGQGEKG